MGRYEQLEYTVLADGDGYEIRLYESYLVAETVVEGSFDSTGSTAFRRLAGFIFGKNSESKKMKMTVPVSHEPVSAGAHRYRFVMEHAYSEATLPDPVDEHVTIVRVPGGHRAARRYRGNRSEQRFRREEHALLEQLATDGITVSGPAAVAVYDGPFVPPRLRRNEVLVPVRWSLPATGPDPSGRS